MLEKQMILGQIMFQMSTLVTLGPRLAALYKIQHITQKKSGHWDRTCGRQNKSRSDQWLFITHPLQNNNIFQTWHKSLTLINTLESLFFAVSRCGSTFSFCIIILHFCDLQRRLGIKNVYMAGCLPEMKEHAEVFAIEGDWVIMLLWCVGEKTPAGSCQRSWSLW